MKLRNYAYTGLLLIMALLLASCSQLGLNFLAKRPGIDEPIEVDGYQLQATTLTFKEEYGTGSQTYKPRFPSETFLIVSAETNATSDELDTTQWEVELEDNLGYYHSPSITSMSSITGEEKTTISWIFVVLEFATEFTLHIDDQEIVLDDLVPEKEEAETEQSTSEQRDDSVISIGLDFCDADTVISADKEIRIYYLDPVDSNEYGEQYLANAQFEVSLDGGSVAAIQGEIVEFGDQLLVNFSNNLGILEAGRHTVEATLSFKDNFQRDENFSCVIITK
jgi:hypothetical protein